jgi:hypothetical protein
MLEPVSASLRLKHAKSSDSDASARVRSFGAINLARLDTQLCGEIMQLLDCDPLSRIV